MNKKKLKTSLGLTVAISFSTCLVVNVLQRFLAGTVTDLYFRSGDVSLLLNHPAAGLGCSAARGQGIEIQGFVVARALYGAEHATEFLSWLGASRAHVLEKSGYILGTSGHCWGRQEKLICVVLGEKRRWSRKMQVRATTAFPVNAGGPSLKA